MTDCACQAWNAYDCASTRMRPLPPDYTRPTADEVDQYGNGPCGCPCHDEPEDA